MSALSKMNSFPSQSIAELAKGVGLSATQQPAWRQTAAKLILLFADEEDGGAQNAVGSEAKYKDSSHAEYFIKLLTKPSEEIGFILMDGDRDNSFKDNGTTPYDPNRAVYKLNNMQDAVNLTAKYGGFLGALKVDSDADDISVEVKNAFNNYKAGVKFDIVTEGSIIVTCHIMRRTQILGNRHFKAKPQQFTQQLAGVRVSGLSGRPQLNGCEGSVLDWSASTGNSR